MSSPAYSLDQAHDLLQRADIRWRAAITRHVDATVIDTQWCELTLGEAQEIPAMGLTWRLFATDTADGDVRLVAEVVSDTSVSGKPVAGISVALVSAIPWHEDAWVGIPAAVYAGNRFDVREEPYPPMFTQAADARADLPITITPVPRLSKTGASAVHLLAGDAAAPAVGWWVPGRSDGVWLLGPADATLGIRVEEDLDRREARIWLQSPGVRPDKRYRMTNDWTTSPDRGRTVSVGDSFEISARVVPVVVPKKSSAPAALWRAWSSLRAAYLPTPESLTLRLPLSAAWAIQQRKRSSENWNEEHGYFRVGTVDHHHQNWQPGWVGGGMDSLAFFAHGTAKQQTQASSTLDFLCGKALGPAGFCYGWFHHGQTGGDGFSSAIAEHWALTRKTADAFYFLMKQLDLLEARGAKSDLRPTWLAGAQAMANAFVRLWHNHGQFGQFVDLRTGDLCVGGSTSASTAPAALILAWRRFGNPTYRAVAIESATQFARDAIALGATTGGPGEILQGADSESAFGLLDSLVVLHEVTGDSAWLPLATAIADQCVSWVQAWDFPFPSTSLFGRLGMQARGSVWANVQNKHSAPAICSLSGDSLLKLARATGDASWTKLLAEITRGIPQYLSREDRRIGDMPAGWMNERVETCDWLEPPGEIFHGSCWCEVSLMLAHAELPGVYVRSDTGAVTVLDQVEATLHDDILTLRNPTNFAAEVKIVVENAAQAKQPLAPLALIDAYRQHVPAQGHAQVAITTIGRALATSVDRR